MDYRITKGQKIIIKEKKINKKIKKKARERLDGRPINPIKRHTERKRGRRHNDSVAHSSFILAFSVNQMPKIYIP